MASSRKPVSEKKGNDVEKKKKKKKAREGNGGKEGKKDIDSSKASNGTANNSKVVPVQSSSSESEREVEDGAKMTKTPSSGSKSGKDKLKVKREREEEKEDVTKTNKFPMERVKRIIRSENSDLRISTEAIFLVNKATEKFIEKFCSDSYACSVKDRKKSLGYKHLYIVPDKLKAEDALAEAKLTKLESG